MALFDPERKRVVIRVVYDGPGHAGKTTNLRRLCKSFASWRRSEMVSPNTVGERTQYFDWLEVDGGLLQGYPVRAQLLTVPGQIELRLRRAFVIERADVVVFVADSQPGAVAEARGFYAELCEQLAGFEHAVPIVFQANKQDVAGALKPPELARRVCEGLRTPAQVSGAVATTDRGVKQTLTIALRLASEQLRKRWSGEDPRSKIGDVGDADTTFAALEHHEAQLALGRAQLRPVLPTPELPSTQVWPPVTGRAVIGRVYGRELLPRSFAEHPERAVFDIEADDGRWRLTSGTDRCYADVDEGQRALLGLCRRRVALGTWLPEPCACAIAVDGQHGAAWLWTLDPLLPTLADELRGDDLDRRREALLRHCEALLGAEALVERHGLVVELTPESFGLQWDDRLRTRYIGHDLEAGDEVDIVGPLLEHCEAFARDEVAIEELVEVLCSGLRHVPRAAERRAALRQAFLDAPDIEPAARRLCAAAAMVLAHAAASENPDAS